MRDNYRRSELPDDDFARRGGWRPGSDYYGNDPRRYRGCASADAGPFRGRGPKGYRRSDDRIREDACEILTRDDLIDASSIDVAVADCEVTLSGEVTSREEKRRAEDLVEYVPGVRDILNQLRVVNRGEPSDAGDRIPRRP